MKKHASYTRLAETQNNIALDIYTHGGREYPAPNGLPTSVVIYGQRYSIRYHSCIYNEPKPTQRLRGVVIYPHRLIILDPKQSIHDLRETLYHEIGHVYLKVGQTKSESLSKLSGVAVEDMCDLFGEAIYDLSSNNSLAKA